MTIHTLDLRWQGQPQLIAAYLVECGKELALIETGPGSTLSTLVEGIRASRSGASVASPKSCRADRGGFGARTV